MSAKQPEAAQPQGDAREAAYASGEGISGAVDGPQFDYHFRLHINTYADKHPMLVVRQLAARLRAAWQSATAQASEPSANIHANSETLPGECWKNPLFPLETRLQMADGAVAFERKVNANLRARLEAVPARVVEPLTDEQWQVIADTLDVFIVREQKDIIERALGITTTPAAQAEKGDDHE